jgi:hypothetical protein
MPAVLSKRDEFLTFVSDIAVVVSDQLAAVEQSRVEEAPIVASTSGIQRLLLDHEKTVWHWPDIGSRLTEDVR